MRIDKFLKNARIIKRRTLAKEACDKGKVLINGKTAKAGAEVEVGDVIEIIFGEKPMKIRAEKLLDHTVKDEYKEMYTLIS
jgi:ribosomal 50S subunit-recycling heat shock protein